MHSLEASILINASVSECYRRWMEFERFPEFMRHVVSVRRADPIEMLPSNKHGEKEAPHTNDPQKDYTGVITGEIAHEVANEGNQVWHWEVRGPLGHTSTWTAGIVMNMPDKAISWVSPYDQEIATSGTVNFLKAASSKPDREQTLLEVRMTFSAPGGALGEFFADALHLGDTVLAESLEDFKGYIEREVHQILNPAQRTTTGQAMSSENELIQEVGSPRTVHSTPRML